LKNFPGICIAFGLRSSAGGKFSRKNLTPIKEGLPVVRPVFLLSAFLSPVARLDYKQAARPFQAGRASGYKDIHIHTPDFPEADKLPFFSPSAAGFIPCSKVVKMPVFQGFSAF